MTKESEAVKIQKAVDRNIAAIHKIRKDTDNKRRFDQKVIGALASFLGSPGSIYLHILGYGACFVLLGLGIGGDLKNNLELTATLEAIFLTLLVLVNQRHLEKIERKSGDLHLQTSLLAEDELTKIARVLDSVASKVLQSGHGNSLEDVKKEIHPDVILEKIAKLEESAPTPATEDKR